MNGVDKLRDPHFFSEQGTALTKSGSGLDAVVFREGRRLRLPEQLAEGGLQFDQGRYRNRDLSGTNSTLYHRTTKLEYDPIEGWSG